MNLAFVVERPTQFEAPFYRYASQDPEHHLRVLFTDPRLAEPLFDPELDRTVSWGFDLLAGYDHAVCPPSGRSRWLARELRTADLVIINGYTQAPYLVAAAVAHRLGIPTALRLDSVLWDGAPSRPHLKRLLFALALKPGYRLFLGTGTLTLDYLRFFGVPPERTGLFPYAVDVDAFRQGSSLSPEERTAVRQRFGLPPDSQVLLSLAKLSPRESPWDLLRAFTRGGDSSDPGRRLVLAGDGPERSALEAFAGAQGAGRVLFPGYIPYPELPALYAAADVFIHPAREERWGVSVAEALACGLPVIASSRVGAARDLIAAGRNGFVYQAGDDAELARCLDDALRLSPAEVRAENRAVLSRWDYAATWQGILRAAARFQKKVNA